MSGSPIEGAEFPRPIKCRALPAQSITLTATAAECAALAVRFDISAIQSFQAIVSFDTKGQKVAARGEINADITQRCAISDEDFPVVIKDSFSVVFTPAKAGTAGFDEEIELTADELDEIEFDGEFFDIGEAAAQSLFLCIDPYAKGPNAGKIREGIGLISDEDAVAEGPLAEALKKLKGEG